jgi:hypothetical protein
MKTKITFGGVLGGALVLVFAGVILAGLSKPFIKEDIRSVTISEKGERCKSRDSCKYMFYTDKGVFQNTDSIVNWKWNSADFYNDIKVGKTYDLRVSGYRIAPVLSWFPNVVEFKEVK